MTYEQILALLDKGLSPADIIGLSNAAPVQPAEEAPAADPTPEAPAPEAPAQETAPEWATALKMSIDRMTNAMHANAIMQQQQPPVKELTAETALASILEPPKKG